LDAVKLALSHSLRVFGNRALRRVFDLRRMKQQEDGDDLIMKIVKAMMMNWTEHVAHIEVRSA
jgi:hypothetical protein